MATYFLPVCSFSKHQWVNVLHFTKEGLLSGLRIRYSKKGWVQIPLAEYGRIQIRFFLKVISGSCFFLEERILESRIRKVGKGYNDHPDPQPWLLVALR